MPKTAPPVHELKCWPEYFEPLRLGNKTFEIRANDRGFRVGDILVLREWDSSNGYTGRVEFRRVTFRMFNGMFVPDGYVALGIKRCKRPEGI